MAIPKFVFKPQAVRDAYYRREYDTKQRWASYWHQIDEVLRTDPKRVLEIGPGNMTVADYLKKRGIEVVTIDADKDLMPDVVGSVTELTNYFDQNSFDTVLCAEVLEHMPFEYFEASLEQMKKVVGMGKYVVLSLPHVMHEPNHYWEIEQEGYELDKILKIISRFFYVVKTYRVFELPQHRFFVLRKI